MEQKEELLELYMQETDLYMTLYEMMGRMLNRKNIASRVVELGLHEVYIYGGGFLGIQLYNAIHNLLHTCTVVDRKGELNTDIPEIPVIGIEKLKDIYINEKIIITPIKFARSIYEELMEFIPDKNLMFLGEFLGGK